MFLQTPAAWTVRGATFVLWALAAGSAAFWGLKLGGAQAPITVPPPPSRGVAAVDPLALARLLGSSPAAVVAAPQPTLASRFQLVGVAAGAESGGGAAVIAVDGKPPRPYRVGAALDEGIVLQSVRGRQAVLGAAGTGQPLLTLELPPLLRQ
jgi:general secretion pathway protein C